MAPTCFTTGIVFFLLLLAIYGMIGAIFNYRELNKHFYDHGKWPFNQRPIYIVFMSNQLGYLIPAVLGLISAVKNTKVYLTYSFFFLLGIFTVLLVFGGVCLRVSSTDLLSDMYNGFRKNLIDDASMDWLSDVQYRYNCCGVFSYMDWGLFNVTLPNGNTSVPDSCCRKEIFIPTVNCGVGYLKPNKTIVEATEFIYTGGCGAVISNMLWNNSKWVGLEMIIASVLTLAVAALTFCDILQPLPNCDEDSSRFKDRNTDDATNNFDVNNNISNGTSVPVSADRSRRGIQKNTSGNTSSSSNNKPKPSIVISVKRQKSPKSNRHKKNKGDNKTNSSFGVPDGNRCGRKQQGVNPRNLFRKYWSPDGIDTDVMVQNQSRTNSTVQRKHANSYPSGYDDDTDSESVSGLMRRNLEMLMNPIAGNFSTLSTTPKPSGSLNFLGTQNSTSPNPRGKVEEKVLQEPNLSHYSSLPLVNANILTNLNAAQISNALQALLPFCNGSHYHRQLPPKYSKLSSEPVAPPVNFVPGKFTSPSMTHSTTLATIQEETESLKSGAGSASPKAASPNTTPQSLSQKTSCCSAEDYNASQHSSDSESSPQGIIIEIVDGEKYQENSKTCEMGESQPIFGIKDVSNDGNKLDNKSIENISKLFLEFQDVNENSNFESLEELNEIVANDLSLVNETITCQGNINVGIGDDGMRRGDSMTDDVALNMEILSGHANMSSLVQNSI